MLTMDKLKFFFSILCVGLLMFCLGWWTHGSISTSEYYNSRGRTLTQQLGEEHLHLQIYRHHPELPIVSTNNSSTIKTNSSDNLPTIFMITPTYKRTTQKVDLTKVCQALMTVKNMKWIIIEDSENKTSLVTRLLKHCPVTSVHLNHKTSEKLRKRGGNRGSEQRNFGIDWLRENYHVGQIQGVVYFGDDDNSYDVRLFEEMRYTKKVSVWPVGFAGGLLAEGPICENGKVINWHVGWSPERKFPVDMAAFAVNLDIFLADANVRLNPFGPGGHLEPEFLKKTKVEVNELEAKASNCKEVYVWHSKTVNPNQRYEKKYPTTLETKR